MAKKAKITIRAGDEIREVDGYLVSPDVGIINTGEGWITIHIKTGDKLVGPRGVFSLKRECLGFAEYLVDAVPSWDFTTKEEMYSVCDKDWWYHTYNKAIDFAV